MLNKLCRAIFRTPKHATKPKKVDKSRVLMSAVSLLACCMAFSASSFAWFTSSQTSEVDVIETGYFDAVTTLGGTTKTARANKPAEFSCSLAARDKQSVTITAEGTSGGYCVVESGGEVYATYLLEQNESITLNIQAAEGTPITFHATWNPPDEPAALSLDGEAAESETAEDEYTIFISETPHEVYAPILDAEIVDMVASYFGISLERLCAYNGVDSVDALPYIELWVPNPEGLPKMTVPDLSAPIEEETPTDETEEEPTEETPDDEQQTRPDDPADPSTTPEPTPAPDATATPEPTPEPEATPEPEVTPEPEPEPETTPEPEATPEPEPEPEPDPEPETTPEPEPEPEPQPETQSEAEPEGEAEE